MYLFACRNYFKLNFPRRINRRFENYAQRLNLILISLILCNNVNYIIKRVYFKVNLYGNFNLPIIEVNLMFD